MNNDAVDVFEENLSVEEFVEHRVDVSVKVHALLDSADLGLMYRCLKVNPWAGNDGTPTPTMI